VGNGGAYTGYAAVYPVFQLCQVVDAVVDEIDLTVASQLKLNGFFEEVVVEGVEFSLDGVAVGWGCGDGTQVPCTHERELKGAGYGGGSHGQGVDIDFQLPELFLDADTEFLFFVDNEQAKVMELDALADEFMGADNDVEATFLEVVEDAAGVGGRTGAAQVIDRAGEVFQAFLEGLVMLEG